MYKNLNAESLGISARQNELIELALTYKFRGLDIDTESFLRQVESRGKEHAVRFLQSAHIRVGGFDLPVRWTAEEATFKQDLQSLKETAEIMSSLGAASSTAIVLPYCDQRPYHEDFEFHRERFSEIGDELKAFGIKLAIGFRAPILSREGHDTQFITTADALVALVKMIVCDNVGMCLDLWHWHVGGGTLEAIKELSVDQIVAVRVADLPADVPLAEVTEEQRLLPGSTGIVPAAETLRWLADSGYSGPVTAHCHPQQFSGVTRIKSVAQASDALDALMRRSAAETESEAATSAAP
jgi:sugar phosphate isomerase/epimerase